MLARSFGIFAGYVLACIAFGAVLVGFVITPAQLMASPSDEVGKQLATAGLLALSSASWAAIFASPLALIAALIAEQRAIREWFYYTVVAVLAAGIGFLAQYVSELQGAPTIFNNYALAAFLTSGIIAGLVYWLVAGRYTRRNLGPPRTMTSSPEKA
jgi:hypothetical protein